jgi:DNA polymerase I-like protein with 3'-5' exonuclease and polymerase domains
MKDAVEQAASTVTSRGCSAAARSPRSRARNWQTRKLGARLAVNSVIQGTAADIIKVARRTLDRRPRGGKLVGSLNK